MKKILIITFCIILLNISCSSSNNEDEQITEYSKNYVASYHDNVLGFTLTELYPFFDGTDEIKGYDTQIRFAGIEYSLRSPNERFKELAKLYKDTAYNNLVVISAPASLSEPLLSISLVSDADYDMAHPAGIPLDDIVKLHSFSPLKFIQSGYKEFYIGNDDDMYNGNILLGKRSGYYLIHKYLNELEREELTLLTSSASDAGVCLRFLHLPTIENVHNITVTVTFQNGKILTANQRFVFPQIQEQ
jgi:hypothetical protein